MIRKDIFFRICAFVLTYFIYSSIAGYRQSWSISKKKIEASGYIKKEALGDCDAIFLFFYGIGNLFLGKKGDEMNLKVFLALGLSFTILSNTIIILLGINDVKEPIYFYLAFMVNGTAQSVLWPGILAILTNWLGKGSKGLIMGIWSTSTNFGNIFMLQMSNILFERFQFSWQHFMFVPLCCLVFSLFLTTILKPYPEDVFIEVTINQIAEATQVDLPVRQSKEEISLLQSLIEENEKKRKAIGFFRALKLEGVLNYTIVHSCIKSGYYALSFWLPYYLQSKRKFGNEVSGLLQINEIMIIISTLGAGHLSDRIKSRAIPLPLMLTIATSALIIIPFIKCDQRYLLYIMIPLACMMVVSPYNQIGSAIASDIAKNKEVVGQAQAVSTVIAIIQGISGIFSAISLKVTPHIVNHFFLFVSILIGVATILVIPLALKDIQDKRRQRQFEILNVTPQQEA